MCAAVYAMPDQFREVGTKSGVPLMWAWPAKLFRGKLARREQLLMAAAMALVAIERLDLAAVRGRRLTIVPPVVGQK